MFHLEIKRDNGLPVRFKPNSLMEHDLVAAIARKIEGAGVGVFRSEKRVIEIVTNALKEVIREAKSEVMP